MPTPTPTANMPSETIAGEVSWSMVDRPRKPRVRITAPTTMYGLTTPFLETMRPETVEEISTPSIIGVVSRPASVGEWPRPIWKYWPRKTAPPNMAMPTARLARMARAGSRRLTTCSGTTGCATLASTATAAPRRTTLPPAMTPVCQEIQSK